MIHLWLVLWVLLPLWPNPALAERAALREPAGSFQADAWGGGPGAPGHGTGVELLQTVQAGTPERSPGTTPRALLPGRAGLRPAPAVRPAAAADRERDLVSPHPERLPYHANAPPLG